MTTESSPEISVLMSVHNNADLLGPALESIQNQSYRDYELLITDDGSTDEVPEILARFAGSDSRVRVLTNRECLGLARSLNAMVRVARGRYLARMDGDDISRPYRFEKQLEVFTRQSAVDVVFGDTCLIDQDGQPVCRSWRPASVGLILKLLPYHNYISHPTVMIRAALFRDRGFYNEACRTGQDTELWIRWSKQGVRFYYLREVLLDYRLNPRSVRRATGSAPADRAYDLAVVCLKNHDRRSALRYVALTKGVQKLQLLALLAVPAVLHTTRTLVRRWLSVPRRTRRLMCRKQR
jgi:glycosyltransferase involved in cell wall biosynthesis